MGPDMGIMEREGRVTDVGCITPGVRKGKMFQSKGEVVSEAINVPGCIWENRRS